MDNNLQHQVMIRYSSLIVIFCHSARPHISPTIVRTQRGGVDLG